MHRVTKAVFPVAGLGSRFLPATKAMPKELLPIVNKPLIQYAAEEAWSAGIETLIFVTGRNKRAIEDHFDGNIELETILRSKGEKQRAEMVRGILPKGIECIFVRQAEQLGLGHAILCAERAVGNDPFAVLLADDFLPIDYGVTKSLIDNYCETSKNQLSVIQIDGEEISNYGVIVPEERGDHVMGLVEKPDYKNAPSNLAVIGRYVLTPEVFEVLRKIKPGAKGEIQLSDALHKLAINKSVQKLNYLGQRFDCGSVEGFLKATIYEGRRQGII